MDLAYLRAHPQHLPTFLTHQRIRETPVGGGDVCTASRLTLDDGTSIFTKTWPSGPPPAGFFEAEAAGLTWLRAAGAPVPEVIVALPDLIALEWIDPGTPSARAAEQLGRDLADLHALSAADVGVIDQIIHDIDGYDAGEAPARTHGDLWPGNVLWAADGRARLIDPAAQGGNRETDLAELALFGGAPHLDRIIAAYEEVWPLAHGWRARIPLHQLHLLLVHTAVFGGSYRGAVRAAADAARRTSASDS